MTIEQYIPPIPHTCLDVPRDTSQMIIAKPRTFRRASKKILSGKSKKNPFINFGGNRQNIGKKMRELWEADSRARNGERYKLINRDQSGADALIVAYLGRPGRYRQLFENNVKPHLYLALNFFPDAWRTLHPKEEVEIALQTPIAELQHLPFWPKLSKLIKSSDDWEPKKRYYYFGKKTGHCLDKDTEVLTQSGWVRVSDYDGSEPLMVWSEQKMFFESPIQWNVFDVNTTLIHFEEDHLDLLVTEKHGIGYYANGKFHKRTAKDLRNYKGARVPTCGEYVGGTIELRKEEVQLLAAIQADGHIESETKVRFHFVKEWKIARVKQLATALGLQVLEGDAYGITSAGNETTKLSICGVKHLLDWLPNKQFTYKLLGLSRTNLNWLLREVSFWDGSRDGVCNTYRSTIIQNIEFIKTLCHLSSQRGTIQIKSVDKTSTCFELFINKRQRSRLNWKNSARSVPYIGKVYCPIVSTGAFLVRRNGKISVTLNSGNYGMRGDKLASIIREETEGEIILQKSDCDMWLHVYHGRLFPEIQQSFQFGVMQQAKRTGALRNLFGWQYNLTGKDPDKLSEKDLNELYSWIPQSTVACITIMAYVLMQEYIEDNDRDWHILQETHDSITMEAPESEVEECATILGNFMQREMQSPVDGVKFKMKSETQIGYNWAPKSDKNPEGLEDIKL